MKTFVDIPIPLLQEAHNLAAHRGTTVEALVEQGLHRVIEERKSDSTFRLRKATFKGDGLQPGAGDWAQLHALACEGRGG
jgi:hypothetical protein